MRTILVTGLCFVSYMASLGATTITVQAALKMLPKDQAKNLVRIEAREGDPSPERWYFQVYDPAAEDGIREFVVSGKEIVASRLISQFLTGAKSEDVVGSKAVKVDSDDLVKLVQQYAEASHLSVAKISYTMVKDASNPAPVWKLNCADDSGKNIASLVINARNANIVSHEGFAVVPAHGGEAKTSPSPIEDQAGKPATRVRTATAVKPTPASAAGDNSAQPTPRKPLFQRMFGGKTRNDQPQPQQNH